MPFPSISEFIKLLALSQDGITIERYCIYNTHITDLPLSSFVSHFFLLTTRQVHDACIVHNVVGEKAYLGMK